MSILKHKTEIILFFLVLVFSIVGFWYFEESTTLKLFVIIIGLLSVYTGKQKNQKKRSLISYEVMSLLIIFLSSITFYNFLYNIGLPLYSVMIMETLVSSSVFYFLIILDGLNDKVTKNELWFLSSVAGLYLLEFFLSVYFWPISTEIKSLIVVLAFYLLINIIYLYIHNMLRLKRILGYIIISLIILGTILLITWRQLPR